MEKCILNGTCLEVVVWGISNLHCSQSSPLANSKHELGAAVQFTQQTPYLPQQGQFKPEETPRVDNQSKLVETARSQKDPEKFLGEFPSVMSVHVELSHTM